MTHSLHLARPYRPTADKDYKLGTTANNVLRLRDLGVPSPDQVIYRPYAESYVRGDLSRVGDGVNSVEWTWDIISLIELEKMLSITFAGDRTLTFATCFINTDYRTGDMPNPVENFNLFSCIIWRPEIFGNEGTPVVRSAHGMQSVVLKFTELESVP